MKFTFAPESTPLDGYTIKRAIHRGGFGEVYYALSDAGKEVALKLLNNNLEVELRGVSQCLNLKHPNLVTIFDMKTDSDGDHWIVMEYVSGEGLDKVTARNPNGMPVEQVQYWLSGMCAGLAFLHDRGIVHRDLKPANIFRDQRTVKIGDVGLSKFISESRRSAQTQSVGTVYYMAPEVARGRYGREVDIYALGVILYELLTGRVPFEGETTAEILMKHLSEKPDLSPVPERLRPVVARALEKDPSRRIADAQQLELEFRNAVLGIATPQPEPSQPRRSREEKRPAFVPVPPAIPETAPHTGSPAPAPQSGGLVGWFKGLPPAAQWIMGGTAVLILFQTRMVGTWFELILGGAILGGIAFCMWRVVQFIVGPFRTPERPPVAPRTPQPPPLRPAAAHRKRADIPPAAPAAPPKPPHRRARVVKSRPLSPATLRKIPMRRRVTEMTGSMTMAAVCTAVITAGLTLTEWLQDPASIGLFALTTLFASWALIVTTKFWEGTRTDSISRRLMLGTVGTLVGAFAFATDQALLADLPAGNDMPSVVASVGTHSLIESGQPTVAAYMVFFGLLFALRRWWWHTDSFRSGRFRISTALLTLTAAFLICSFFDFSHVWGMMWAVAISCVVQLASVWVPAEERERLAAPARAA